MKKLITLLLLATMIMSLAACDFSPSNDDENTTTVNNSTSKATSTKSTTTSAKSNEPAYEITYQNATAYKNSLGIVRATVIYEVTNTGSTDLYMGAGSYDLEDAEGTLVASSSMVSVYPQIISPGEKAYYFDDSGVETLTDVAELTVIPRAKADAAKVDKIDLPVTDISINADSLWGLKTLGRVENTTADPLTMVYIAVVLYGEDDAPLGVQFTILTDELAPTQKVGFEISGVNLTRGITPETVTRFEAFAYEYQFQF